MGYLTSNTYSDIQFITPLLMCLEANMAQPSLAGRRMNIVTERTRRGMSQEALAAAVHAHLNSVSRWESGQVAPDGMHLLAMSELFGADPAYLMERVGDKDA